jgi:recombination protein RecR
MVNVLPISLQKLMSSLERLPGLGPKSAARIAFFLLKSPDTFVHDLGSTLVDLKKNIHYCQTCFCVSSSDPCVICSNEKRDKTDICIVEDALDVVAFENGTDYNGVYHVLGGSISPVNGIGPDNLTIEKLIKRVKENYSIKEIILATNPNIEGEATAMYIRDALLKIKDRKLRISRLARGLPTGADIEYADRTTIKKALEGRTLF